MTDEMTIQQRKSPLVPTVLGAAAGTGIGYGVGHLMTKPMTHEDIIKDINDTTTFSNRVKEGAPEAATWQEVKNKADEVAKLRVALDEAKLGELKDTTLASKIEKAKQEIENELEKYTKEKTVTRGTAETKILALSNDWAMTPLQRDEYTNLYTGYTQVTNAIENNPEVMKYKGLIDGTNGRKTTIESTFKDIVSDYKDIVEKSKDYNQNIQTVDDYLSIKKNKKRFNFFSGKGIESKFDTLVNNSKLAELAETDYAELAKKVKGQTTDTNGTLKKGFLKYNINGSTYTCRLSDVTEREKIKKDQVTKYFKEKLSDYIEYEKQSNDESIAKNIRSRIKNKTLAKNAGLTYKGGEIENLLDNVRDYANKLDELNKDLDTIGKVKTKSKGQVYTKEVEDILTKYGCDDLDKVKNIIGSRRTLANMYNEETARVGSLLDDILAADSDLPKLQKLLRKAEGDVTVDVNLIDNRTNTMGTNPRKMTKAQIETTIRSKYKSHYPTQTVKTETVAGATREEAIEKSGETYKKLQKNLDDLLEQAKTAERKAANPEKIKTAQDAFDAGEKSLKEMAESLGKKMTKGPNKWVAAGIGAAALGLATLLAVNSKNNKAQA